MHFLIHGGSEWRQEGCLSAQLWEENVLVDQAGEASGFTLEGEVVDPKEHQVAPPGKGEKRGMERGGKSQLFSHGQPTGELGQQKRLELCVDRVSAFSPLGPGEKGVVSGRTTCQPSLETSSGFEATVAGQRETPEAPARGSSTGRALLQGEGSPRPALEQGSESCPVTE